MNYEEKLKEALNSGTTNNEVVRWIECNFPELKENEDEKMLRVLREGFNILDKDDEWYSGITNGQILAWLEKQGEQKPADSKTKAGNWYICDIEVANENMKTALHPGKIYYCPKDGYLDVGGALLEVGCLDVFRPATEEEIPQPKQNPAWSEEDEKIKESIIIGLEMLKDGASDKSLIALYNKKIDWLKSLKARCTWKPSDKQMEAVRIAAEIGTANNSWAMDILKNVYQDLKRTWSNT